MYPWIYTQLALDYLDTDDFQASSAVLRSIFFLMKSNWIYGHLFPMDI